MKNRIPSFFLVPIVCLSNTVNAQPNYSHAKQGFSMRVQMMNLGAWGRIAYPPFNSTPNPPNDSLGVEYPVGQPIEHVYGAGLWVGGKLDTSRAGTGTSLKLVTTGYESWSGPFYEWFPGSSTTDTIWKIMGRGAPEPSGWGQYWGTSLPFTPVADQNFYCTFTDTSRPVLWHIPLRLKVIQSSYAWNDTDALMVFEYRIMNNGSKMIDSVYVGYLIDADVGPLGSPSYYTRNYSAYYSAINTAYTHNPVDVGSTPIGLRVLWSSVHLERITFQWYPGPQSPSPDVNRYNLLSSGVIKPDEFPNQSDTRFLLGGGPFQLRPPTDPNPDTLIVAFALLSGQNLTAMQQNAVRADSLYRTLLTSVGPTLTGLPDGFSLLQNYPNPFNPSTSIEFSLPTSTYTTLKIFDVLGREVTSLVDGELRAGTYKATWDAVERSSGIYYCRLQAGGHSATRKLILLK